MTVLLGLYVAVWIPLEGELRQVVLLGVAVSVVSAGHWLQNYFGGRTMSLATWLLISAMLGLWLGMGGSLLTLVFMAMKTGLHAHGPEFTPQEILWVVQQIPLWTIVGGLSGLGLGMLCGALSQR